MAVLYHKFTGRKEKFFFRDSKGSGTAEYLTKKDGTPVLVVLRRQTFYGSDAVRKMFDLQSRNTNHEYVSTSKGTKRLGKVSLDDQFKMINDRSWLGKFLKEKK